MKTATSSADVPSTRDWAVPPGPDRNSGIQEPEPANFPAAGKVPHNRYLQGGGKCLDCHSEVHGSNVDERMAPQYRKR